jgi:hypothetical protein
VTHQRSLGCSRSFPPGFEVAEDAGRRARSVRFQRVTSSVIVTLWGKRMGSSGRFLRLLSRLGMRAPNELGQNLFFWAETETGLFEFGPGVLRGIRLWAGSRRMGFMSNIKKAK